MKKVFRKLYKIILSFFENSIISVIEVLGCKCGVLFRWNTESAPPTKKRAKGVVAPGPEI